MVRWGDLKSFLSACTLPALCLAIGFLMGAAWQDGLPDVAAGYAPSKHTLYDWQTLITGVLALIGAGLTVWAVRKQIEQADRVSERNWKAESYAARAELPLALSEITQYAQSCLRILEAIDEYGERGDRYTSPLPFLNPAAVQIITRCIRYADSTKAKELADLVSFIQVHDVNLGELWEQAETYQYPRVGWDIVINSAELYQRASLLFDYGRRVEEIGESMPSVEGLRSALSITRVSRVRFKAAFDHLNRREGVERGEPEAHDEGISV